VERAYAQQRPEDFVKLVRLWGHTAIADTRHSASAYLAGRSARWAMRDCRVPPWQGRWAVGADVSYWAPMPPPVCGELTTWTSEVGDPPGQHGTPGPSSRGRS
jgi:hypothetical protein